MSECLLPTHDSCYKGMSTAIQLELLKLKIKPDLVAPLLLEQTSPPKNDYLQLSESLQEDLTGLNIQQELTSSPIPRRFSYKARRWLDAKGYEIVTIPGNPLSYWTELPPTHIYRKLASVNIAHNLPDYVRNQSYAATEIGVNRDKLFIPNSCGKNKSVQSRLLNELITTLPDCINAFNPTAAQVVDLIMADLLREEARVVLGKYYGYPQTRTETKVDDYAHCKVGITDRFTCAIDVTRSANNGSSPILGQCSFLFPKRITSIADLAV